MRHIASFSSGNVVVVCGIISTISLSSLFFSSNLNVVTSARISSEAASVLGSTVTIVDDSSSTSEEYDSEESSDSCQDKDEEGDTGEN